MPITEKQKANLIPAKKGEVRNPTGKVKGTLSAKVIIRKWLEAGEQVINPSTNQKEYLTVLDSMTLALIKKAKKGDVQAFNSLLDRTEGKPKQEHGFTNTEGQDVTPIILNPAPNCEPLKSE